MSLAAAQAMVRRNPEDADARMALAEALVAAGSPEQARASFEHALRLDGSLVSRHLGTAGEGASAYDQDAALRLLDLALALIPNDPELEQLRETVETDTAATRAVTEHVVRCFDRLAGRAQ